MNDTTRQRILPASLIFAATLAMACGDASGPDPDEVEADGAREGQDVDPEPGDEPGDEPGAEPGAEPGDEPGEEPDPTVVDPPTCGGDEGCVDVFPNVIMDTTVGGTRDWGTYGCAPETNEGGPERAYRVVLPSAGFLAARLRGQADGVDIDVHVLSARDADACLDRGHLAAGAYLGAGEYWVVADTWVDGEGVEYAGAFELELELTRPEDLEAHGMGVEVAFDALTAFSTAWSRGETKRLEYTISDFSMHSSLKRQWVVDLATGELLYTLHVGHGENSIVGDDLGVSSVFSNVPQSHQSSLGLMRAAESYTGDYGYSMRLDGLEPGFNDNVRARDIVVHPWDGNRPDVIADLGWVAPSWGCATLEPTVSAEVIDMIRDGSLMFFWYPDETWRRGSTFL